MRKDGITFMDEIRYTYLGKITQCKKYLYIVMCITYITYEQYR